MPTLRLPSQADPVEGLEAGEAALIDLNYTLGVMCRPEGDYFARDLVNGHLLDDIVRDLRLRRQIGMPLPAIDTGVMLDAIDHVSPRVKLWGELADDRLAYLSSGLILRWVLSRAAHPETRSSATVNKATDEVQKWLVRHRLSGGARSDNVRRWWRTFRPVSHLWAAWQMLAEAGIHAESPSGFRSLLETARLLRKLGTNTLPLRARRGDNLLGKDTWQIPDDLPTAPFVVAWLNNLDAHDIAKMSAPSMLKA